MFPHQEHFWFIGCVFYKSCLICAFFMSWSIFCFLILSMSCLFYALQHFFQVFCLLFELHFFIHLVPLMHHYPCSYLLFFPSFFLAHLSIRVKKEESIVESIPGSILLLCTFLGREILEGGCIYQGGEDIFLYEKTLFCFVLHYVCALMIACLDDQLLCYVIIVVISL